MNNEDKFISIKKGLLELAVLKIISRDKVYAADILEKLSHTEFASKEGTLYPLLSRLKREGALNYEWAESAAGPPRKYFGLTDKGKEQLAALMKYWKDLDSTINNF
ncbi:MAG TPA: PadR family transcriptional regulator [Candidatus Methylomirabilis sp.]|nr:PadR family transcriptional regulator [Candidatus Methylomirabilis sp.]